MEGESLDQAAGELEAAHRIAQLVQWRAPQADTADAGDDQHQTAGDARFRRQADDEGKLPRKIIHAAGQHQRERVADYCRLGDAVSGQRTDTAIGQGRGRDRKGAAIERDGTAAEIEVERPLDNAALGEDAMALHQPRQGVIALCCALFRPVDGLVEAAGLAADGGIPEPHQHVEALGNGASRADHGAAHDGAGIDHRVVGAIIAIERQFVEALTGGFTPDMVMHITLAIQAQGERVIERLDHGLQTEGRIGLAERQALAVNTANGEAKGVRVLLRQFRNIIGHRSACGRLGVGVDIGDPVLEHGKIPDCQIAIQNLQQEATDIRVQPGFDGGGVQRGAALEKGAGLGQAGHVEVDAALQQALPQLGGGEEALFAGPPQHACDQLTRCRSVRDIVLEAGAPAGES